MPSLSATRIKKYCYFTPVSSLQLSNAICYLAHEPAIISQEKSKVQIQLNAEWVWWYGAPLIIIWTATDFFLELGQNRMDFFIYWTLFCWLSNFIEISIIQTGLTCPLRTKSSQNQFTNQDRDYVLINKQLIKENIRKRDIQKPTFPNKLQLLLERTKSRLTEWRLCLWLSSMLNVSLWWLSQGFLPPAWRELVLEIGAAACCNIFNPCHMYIASQIRRTAASIISKIL